MVRTEGRSWLDKWALEVNVSVTGESWKLGIENQLEIVIQCLKFMDEVLKNTRLLKQTNQLPFVISFLSL